MSKSAQTSDKKLIDVLINNGLSENEARVYLALLTLGQTGIAALSRKSKLHGQLVYRALAELETRQLVDKTTINQRARYTARSPQLFLKQVSETRDKLAASITQLENLHTTNLSDQLQMTLGRAEFVATELAMISKTPKQSELLIISGENDQFWHVMGEHMNEHDFVRQKREICIRYVGSEVQRRNLTERQSPLFSFRLLPHHFTGTVNIAVFPQIFGTYIFTDPPASMYVHNQHVAESYRSFFEALWKMGK